MSNCKLESLIVIFPFIIWLVGSENTVSASRSIATEVLAISLSSWYNETGKLSIAVPLFFSVTFNSIAVGLVSEI